MSKLNYLSSGRGSSASNDEDQYQTKLEGYKIETDLDLKLFCGIFENQKSECLNAASLQDPQVETPRISLRTVDEDVLDNPQ